MQCEKTKGAWRMVNWMSPLLFTLGMFLCTAAQQALSKRPAQLAAFMVGCPRCWQPVQGSGKGEVHQD